MAALDSAKDAVLGLQLGQVRINKSCGLIEALDQAVRVWAPFARIQSRRISAGAPERLQRPSVSGRIYAISRDQSGDVVLQIQADDTTGAVASATFAVNLPCASVNDEPCRK